MAEFTRGFKSWAERTALRFRQDIGVEHHAPLLATSLAEHLGVVLLTPHDVLGLSKAHLRQLIKEDAGGWSAITLHLGEQDVVIYNPAHSARRISSDIMHELSHIVSEHKPAQAVLSADGKMLMRHYDPRQEREAAWLSGCLLLPREALLHIKEQRVSDSQVCQNYAVSSELLRWRVNVTGVAYQIKRSVSKHRMQDK
ncbi:ImmA/IrrE family metallo-endopeptidase [Elusimicrobiota bacterium]